MLANPVNHVDAYGYWVIANGYEDSGGGSTPVDPGDSVPDDSSQQGNTPYDWKVDRRTLMQLLGAKVYASPSKQTKMGREILARDANHHGSLGIAVSEGLEYTEEHEGSVYCLGSVLNHVLMHQTIIGLETIKQFELIDDQPDLIVGCLGGGSNFGGISLPFVGEVLKKKRECEFLAAQTMASPSLLKGRYEYDFGDVGEHTPLMKMYTLGHKTEMKPIKADGLRYHAAAPIISFL